MTGAACQMAFPGESGAGELRAEAFDFDKLQSEVLSTIDKAMPAVVSIGVGDRGGFSGVIVSAEGHVLSAGHAVKPGRNYQVKLGDGRRLKARGLGASNCLDCALVKIVDGGDFPFVEIPGYFFSAWTATGIKSFARQKRTEQ